MNGMSAHQWNSDKHPLDQAEKLKQVQAELIETLKTAGSVIEFLCNGIQWNIDNHPTVMNEADADAVRGSLKFLGELEAKVIKVIHE